MNHALILNHRNFLLMNHTLIPTQSHVSLKFPNSQKIPTISDCAQFPPSYPKKMHLNIYFNKSYKSRNKQKGREGTNTLLLIQPISVLYFKGDHLEAQLTSETLTDSWLKRGGGGTGLQLSPRR